MDKVVVLNAQKMNYDGLLDFDVLAYDTPTGKAEVIVYDDTEETEILARIQDASCVITKELVVPAEIMAKFSDSVKLIVEAGTGYNNLPLTAAKEKGITVCNVPAYSSERVAHTAIMLLLNLASTMQIQLKMLAEGDRSNFTEHLKVPHVELNGKTLGLIGYGNIGQKTAAIARAMDMNVLVYTRTPKEDEPAAPEKGVGGWLRFTDKETMLRESDAISLHCPLTEETKHIIGSVELAMMKTDAFLINTARGALIDETALISALEGRGIAGAGLDVQEKEPPAEDNPLYTMDNVILTPHMGWKGLETRQRLLQVVESDIKGFFTGSPVNVVS